MCCSPWGQKDLDMTERLNDNNMHYLFFGHTMHHVGSSSLTRHGTQASCTGT